MSQQSLRQASIRAVTSTTYTYEGDWHALWDLLGIAAGQFNERMLLYINNQLSSSYTELNGAMAAFAAEHGSTTFQAIGTFTPGFSLTAPVLAFASATDPDSDNTQNLTADFADDILGNTVRLVGTFGSATVSEPYDVDDDNTIDAGEDAAKEAAFTTGAIDDGVCSFKCRVEDGSGNALSDWSNTVTKTIDATAPTITSSTTANNAENVVLAHALTANESVTWALNGGDDVALFEISGSTLRWDSNGTQDYETPADDDADNEYLVTVRATDTAGNTTDQNIAITVTDVAESVGYVKTDNPAVQDLSFGSATATFSNCAVGTAATDRVVIVCIANNARTLTGVTIGGVTATEAVSSNTGAHTAIWYAIVPTGTTATVVITAAANFGKIGITVGKLNSATSAPTSTGLLAAGFRADPQLASSATIPSNGVGVIAMGDIDTAQGALTWNNATEDYSTTGTAFGVASGNRTTAGAFQASISGVAFNNLSMAVACWGP